MSGTENGVRSKLREALAKREVGLVSDDGTLAMGQFLDKWLTSTRDTVKDRTWVRHEEIVRLHLSPHLGNIRLGRLDPMRVQTLYRAKLDSGLSARTVQIIHTTLHKALKQAVRWRLVARNVSEDVDPPRPARSEIQPLTRAEARTLLDTARGDPLEALYVMALTTGMRSGELVGLMWEDVDLETRVVRVRRTVWAGKASAPKTNAARRQIGLSTRAVAALLEHRAESMARLGYESQWVFCSRVGTPLSIHNVHNRSWKPLLKRAGLPKTTRFHDLRHTCATLLLGRSVHPKLVQALMGHASIEVTMNTYSHVMPDMGEATTLAMNDALGGGSRKVSEASTGRRSGCAVSIRQPGRRPCPR